MKTESENRTAAARMLDGILREFVDTGIAAIFDRAPITFTPANEKGVRPVRRMLSRPAGRRYALKHALARNSFLCGCLDATEHEIVEHLIVGFGRRRGSTTWVDAIHHEVGDEHSIPVPAALSEDMAAHLASDVRREVILFHNHPPNFLNVLFDNEPLPSSADRATLLKMRYFEPRTALRAFLGGGNVRFYLGENGLVKEFRAPGVLQMLQLAERARQLRR